MSVMSAAQGRQNLHRATTKTLQSKLHTEGQSTIILKKRKKQPLRYSTTVNTLYITHIILGDTEIHLFVQ